MVLFRHTRILNADNKNKCLETVIERKNDDLLANVPVCLEIPEDATCYVTHCGS